MVALNPLLLHLARDMLRLRHDRAQRGRVRRGLVRRDAVGPHVRARDRLLEEGRGRCVTRLTQVDVDHLSVLVAGTVGVDPVAGQADVGLVNGLTAKGKFCLTRFGRLRLSWSRSAARQRYIARTRASYPSDEQAHRGGQDETSVADAPPHNRRRERATALGSRLPPPAAVDGRPNTRVPAPTTPQKVPHARRSLRSRLRVTAGRTV